MLTVKSVTQFLTDPKRIMGEMQTIFREIDPEYPAEEAAYFQAIQTIPEQLPPEMRPEVMALISLQEQALASDFLFLIWNGLRLNLDCFYHPTSKLFLKLDYEEIHQEETMQTMPVPRKYWKRVDAFYRGMNCQQHELFSPFTSYYTYLQTTGYKLAHYFGFVLGNELLPFVVPGYSPDQAISSTYGMELKDYLQVDIRKLTA